MTEHQTTREAPVPILIDGKKVDAPSDDLTGAQIRHLVVPPIGPDRDLWLDRERNLDDLIEDNETVELRPHMRFFTVPKVINPGGGPHAAPR
jgi:hypothetical protein